MVNSCETESQKNTILSLGASYWVQLAKKHFAINAALPYHASA